MSVTITANPNTLTVARTLADYDLHHSASLNASETEIVHVNERPTASVVQGENPDWWPRNYQRIPAHRPINYQLDRSVRPVGSSTPEMCFILTMLGGVALLSVSSNSSYTTCLARPG